MKSIMERYNEGLRSIPIARNGLPEPIEVSRLKTQLYYDFWRPIGDIIDPQSRWIKPNSPAQSFFIRDKFGNMSAREMEESRQKMRELLQVERLGFGTWFHLRPIFEEALKHALTRESMDVVMCMMTQHIRLELGHAEDPGYSYTVSAEEPDRKDILYDENWTIDDEIFRAIYGDPEPEFGGGGSSEFRMISWVLAWQRAFNDPAEFEKEFPGQAHRRANIACAMNPVFARDWVLDHSLIDSAVGYAKKLLSINFDETRAIVSRNDVEGVA